MVVHIVIYIWSEHVYTSGSQGAVSHSIGSGRHCVKEIQVAISTNMSYTYIQGVTGGMCETSGECSLGQTTDITQNTYIQS